MADSYDRYDSEAGGGGFMMGLLTGAVLGAGLGMLLAPKAGSELRGVINEQARTLGTKANEQYKKVAENAPAWAERGREFVDKAREAVVKGAEEARGYATSGATSGANAGATGGANATGSSFGSTGTTPGSDFNRS